MRNQLVAAFCVAILCSAGSAFAQQGFEGLDLSDDKKEEPKKEEPEATTPPPSTVKTATDVSPEKADAKKKDGPAVERDTTQDDRVKSVQKKLYLKRGRFELAPSFIINVNDAYYTKLGGAIRAAFYPADSLAISARFSIMQTLPTDDVRTAKRNLNSRIFFSVPIWSVMGDIEWSPLYGKVAFFNDILHLDGYLVGGGGVVWTETSANRGVNPAFDLGLGFRFVVKDFMAVNVALINTTYVDTPTGTTKGVVQNMMMVNAGLSIFIPFKSTYREE
ncbi:MAG: outer membrane beta-barrel domain-containing protein [Archangium sp.]|nr:outer membrane beta-barrel domain-containing protein [Archangium sp.]